MGEFFLDDLGGKGGWGFQVAFGVGKLLVGQSVVKTNRQPENSILGFQAAFGLFELQYWGNLSNSF